MALWHKVGLSPEYTSVPILLAGLGLQIGYVYGLYRLGKLLWSREVGLWAAWIAALFPSVIFHFSKGLEAGLLAVLGLYFLVELLGERRVGLLALLAAVGTFVRLDFVLWVGALLIGDRLKRREILQGRGWGLMLFSGGAAGVVALGVLGWQRAYYGSWLPNTYFLKVSSFPFGCGGQRSLGYGPACRDQLAFVWVGFVGVVAWAALVGGGAFVRYFGSLYSLQYSSVWGYMRVLIQ